MQGFGHVMNGKLLVTVTEGDFSDVGFNSAGFG